MPGLHVPLREATPYGQSPNYLIRDRDGKFGSCFAHLAATSCIEILKTPYHAPRANAMCEWFLGSVRRECLDHLFICQEKQLHRVLHAYVQYFNQAKPHQGIKQQLPERYGEPALPDHDGDKIHSFPVLGGFTTSIAEVLELLRVCEEADGSVGGSALHLGSRILSVLFCRFSRMNATNKRYVPCLVNKNASRYNVTDFLMTTLFSQEKHASRRLLKRSNPPFFRQMLQVASITAYFSRLLEAVSQEW